MKPGSTSDVVRFTWDWSDTTAPMCGAIEPVAPPGLRAICAHACPSVGTAAHERPERTNETLPSCAAVIGIKPCGKRTLLLSYDVGAKSDGVQAPSFRSHVSMLLGAPGRKMKMQFFAVFLRRTPDSVTAPWSRRGLETSAKEEATSPVPATCRNRRREKPSPSSGKPLLFAQVVHSAVL